MTATSATRGRATVGSASRRQDPTSQLRFIRRSMERAGQFTAMSGTAQVGVGGIGLAAALLATRTSSPATWLAVWLAAAVLAVGIAGWAFTRKAVRLQVPLWSGPTRRFALGFCPALAAGAVLTAALYGTDLAGRIPAVWLLLYGTAITAGGAASVGLVPIMGVAFMATGLAALLAPIAAGDAFLAFGFGALHVFFGILIARWYGG